MKRLLMVLMILAVAGNSWAAYVRDVTVSYTADASNVPTKIVLTSANFDFTKVNATASDIHFTSATGTALSHWIQYFNATEQSAKIWVKVPSVTNGDVTIKMLYGGDTQTQNGADIFTLFDDFTDNTAKPQFFNLTGPTSVMTKSFEASSPHTMSVVERHDAGNLGYIYWGYYGTQNPANAAAFLAHSNDLTTWTKYSETALISPARWPTMGVQGGVYYMVYTADPGETHPYIKLASSADGITFADVKTLVVASAVGTTIRSNNFLWYNPNDTLWYLYWYEETGTSNKISVRSAANITDLDAAADTVLMTRTSVLPNAAPAMFYYDGVYYLSIERRDLGANYWQTDIFTSAAATGPFVLTESSPIIGTAALGQACFLPFQIGTTLHAYTCQYNSGTSTWDLAYWSSDLTAGRSTAPVPKTDRWTADGSNPWKVASGLLPDGRTGNKLNVWTRFTATSTIISADSLGDYVLEVDMQSVSDKNTNVMNRYTDITHMYSSNLYQDLDAVANFYLYKWNGTSSTAASTALGAVTLNTWYHMKYSVNSTNIKTFINDVEKQSITNSPWTSGKIGFAADTVGSGGTTTWPYAEWANIFVRPYLATEPTHAVGAEGEQVAATVRKYLNSFNFGPVFGP